MVVTDIRIEVRIKLLKGDRLKTKDLGGSVLYSRDQERREKRSDASKDGLNFRGADLRTSSGSSRSNASAAVEIIVSREDVVGKNIVRRRIHFVMRE